MRRLTRIALTGLACLLVTASAAAATTAPIRVAIYTHSGEQSSTVRTLRKLLSEADGFRAQPITPQAIRRGDLGQYDVIIVPGGSASRQARMLGPQGREAIRHFVHHGGGYVASVRAPTWRLPITPGPWACSTRIRAAPTAGCGLGRTKKGFAGEEMRAGVVDHRTRNASRAELSLGWAKMVKGGFSPV
jgi:putative intracellular protease/amidase